LFLSSGKKSSSGKGGNPPGRGSWADSKKMTSYLKKAIKKLNSSSALGLAVRGNGNDVEEDIEFDQEYSIHMKYLLEMERVKREAIEVEEGLKIRYRI